jgi:hypothetical protein
MNSANRGTEVYRAGKALASCVAAGSAGTFFTDPLDTPGTVRARGGVVCTNTSMDMDGWIDCLFLSLCRLYLAQGIECNARHTSIVRKYIRRGGARGFDLASMYCFVFA